MVSKVGGAPPVRHRGLWAIVFFMLYSMNAIAADVYSGERIYSKHCEQCHSSDGRGLMPTMPDFSRAEKLMAPDTWLYSRISSGKGICPGYEGVLDRQGILDVIVYLRTFYQ